MHCESSYNSIPVRCVEGIWADYRSKVGSWAKIGWLKSKKKK